jgi:hypothetical protein
LHDPTLGEIVGAHVDDNPIPWQETNVVDPHLARDVGEHLMPVIETDFEGSTRERLDDFSLETDEFFVISHISTKKSFFKLGN